MKKLLSTPTTQRRLTVNILLKNMRLEVVMRAIKVEECETDRENSTIKMEDIMKAAGKTTRWMVMANFTMKEENWLMKDNGLKISSMAEEKFITMHLNFYKENSTMKIFRILNSTGNITMVILSIIYRRFNS